MAKQLFEDEHEKLVVEAKVQRANAASIEMKCSTATTERIVRRPVLTEEDEETTEEFERIFEDEFDGEVPDVLVGLEFPQRGEILWQSHQRYGEMPRHTFS